ncbi:hypothetical protein O6P43_026692 [Quillaja saponaria]|uniref:Uncharacterized protein n=1 Tax=Quillaja saponaria TaxID=32244 RepID=A0AAD7PD27_QUISA|nr:hypothetical protein O6P43_026692 [Quillaja saponaria]
MNKPRRQLALEKKLDSAEHLSPSRLYSNGWVGYRVWLKEHNPSLDISEAKCPGKEEAEEEERLAKILAEAESAIGKGCDEEGIADREVETIELDADGVDEGGKKEDNDTGDQ